MPSKIGFLICRQRVATLSDVKTLVVELEDELITAGKWKREVQVPNAQPSTSSNHVIQRLMNDVITLKRQLPKASTSYSSPYQDISRRNTNQSLGIRNKSLQLPPTQQRLAIEAPPPKGSMCVFHLIDDHDGNSCPEMVRYAQLISSKEISN